MRKYLIKENGSFYKANLHSHSTVSDGNISPEGLKKAYKEKGYSILSLTDHEILVSHEELNDKNFLMLPGYEVSIVEEGESKNRKCCHLNLYPIDKDNLKQPSLDDKVYNTEYINKVVREARENGFIASYNHPTWSMENFSNYINYDGFFTIEIVNYCCACVCCLPEMNTRVYDDMLHAGKRLFCSANDDNHNSYDFGHEKCDSFGGFTMIKADALTHEAVMDSLINGEFYASTGPLIYELYVEDAMVNIKCSPAADIRIINAGRHCDGVHPGYDAPVENAKFDVPEAENLYFRIEVRDVHGNTAYTRAYFLDELNN